MNKKFGGGKQPTGTPSMAWSCVVVIVSLLAGASIVHNIYKPNLVCSQASSDSSHLSLPYTFAMYRVGIHVRYIIFLEFVCFIRLNRIVIKTMAFLFSVVCGITGMHASCSTKCLAHFTVTSLFSPFRLSSVRFFFLILLTLEFCVVY